MHNHRQHTFAAVVFFIADGKIFIIDLAGEVRINW